MSASPDPRDRWVRDGARCVGRLIASPEATELDRLLLGEHFKMFAARAPLPPGPDGESEDMRKLRACRLKLAGYVWDRDAKIWRVLPQAAAGVTAHALLAGIFSADGERAGT